MSGRLNSVIRRERVGERETEGELSTDVHYDALTSLKYRKKISHSATFMKLSLSIKIHVEALKRRKKECAHTIER